jgi:hypothetical protein
MFTIEVIPKSPYPDENVILMPKVRFYSACYALGPFYATYFLNTFLINYLIMNFTYYFVCLGVI